MKTNIHTIDQKMQSHIACSYLFSPGQDRTKGFTESLNVNILKKAFRQKAKRYHPDLHVNSSKEMILKRQERFVKIKKSYEYLFLQLQENNQVIERSNNEKAIKTPRIIAVGGAKGGIGKSIFTANLSVYLSSKGFDTVCVDADLGGSNLHLYLGRPHISKTINHYLSNKTSSLNDILEKTKYGPRLIGGNSTQLGVANIGFARKLKLLKAIKNIDADYVVIDLGGDTSYNVLDFFLTADLGIVMTTCDPASYLDAYSFIKVALYRKLNRLFGSESNYVGEKDYVLKKLIHDATMSGSGESVKNIDELFRRVEKEHPGSIDMLKKVVNSFVPQIIVNKVPNEEAAMAPVKRIQQVSRKNLSIDVGYLCSFPFQTEIERSARTLVPWISEAPVSKFAKTIASITAMLMNREAMAN
jgi:flagellar biosynthesis protein FlhG